MHPRLALLAASPLLCGAQDAPVERTSHIGRYVGTVSGLAAPRAVTFDRGGRLWVAEGGDAATGARARALELTFGEDGVLVASAPSEARGAGALLAPAGIAVDGAGNVYVTDEQRHLVLRLGADGAVEELARGGPTTGAVVQPAGLELGAVDGADSLVVCDAGNGRVQVLGLADGEWRALPRGPLVRPVDACIMADGSIVTSDAARQRLDHFTASGAHLRAFSDWGSFPSLVSTPLGLGAIGALVLVADTENHRVQAFDPAKELPLAYRFGVHAILPGEGEGKLHYPRDLAVHPGGDLIAVPEPLDDRVQLFARAPGAAPKEDTLRASIGGPSAHFGPQVSASGQFLVTCSPESHKVQLHDMRLDEPVKIADLFGYGTRLGMLRGPAGLWLDDEGQTLLVTDVGNRRLTRVRLEVEPDEPLAQMPDVAVYEDALDLSRVDLGALPGVELAPGSAAPIVPGAVCRLATAEGPVIVVADRGNGALIAISDELQPIGVLTRGDDWRFGAVTGLAPLPGAVDDARGVAVAVSGADDPVALAYLPGAQPAADEPAWLLARGETTGMDELRGRRSSGIVFHGDSLLVTLPDACRVGRLRVRAAGEPGGRAGARELVRAPGFGAEGLGPAEFLDPRGLAVLGDGRLVVIDHGNHRGQIFDPEGNFRAGFGSRFYTAQLRR
ncbi:MAG: NHL repeat-containing protein [Planctomycetota bacterium]|nr:NHL repeat-containing protein [Planctomycetota bacterium]